VSQERLQSCLYLGYLRHRRFAPRAHAFRYRLCMVYLDLAELDRVFRNRWFWSTQHPALAWLRRADYIGDPGIPLDQAVRDCVERETGRRPAGPVRLLTHLRAYGHCFNPVSFYYCYDPSGERIESIVTDITNTPWKERHAYVLPAPRDTKPGPKLRFSFAKSFHVSPFMPMEIDYDWRFTPPGEKLIVHMLNRRAGETIFDATLTLQRHEITGTSLALALVRYPFATLQVVGTIYWQALRLWLKGVPFHVHPAKRIEEKRT
jgi:DUF1365 family protein